MSKEASTRIDSNARTALAGGLFLSALRGFEDHFGESVRRDSLHRVDRWRARWRRRLSDTGSLLLLAAGAVLAVNVVKAERRERRQAMELGQRSTVGDQHRDIRTGVVRRAQALARKTARRAPVPRDGSHAHRDDGTPRPAIGDAAVSAW